MSDGMIASGGETSGAAGAPAGRMSPARLVAFSSVMVPVTAAALPVTVYLPAIYAQHFGLPLGILGVIFLAERVWGAASDPIIGILSDRTRGRFGRRRPWIVAGGALFAVATLCLFFPQGRVTPVTLTLGLFSFYLAWSMMQIPFFAWSGEISDDYHERTRIATYQSVIAAVALLVVLMLPTWAERAHPNDHGLKLALMGGAILASLGPALAATLLARGEAPAPPRPAPAVRTGIGEVIAIVARDGALLRVLASDFLVSTGQMIRGSLIVLYVSHYVGLPGWSGLLLLSQFVFGIVAGPIWAAIARRIGKHRATVAAELAQMAINLGLLFVQPGGLGLLLALTVAQGLAQGSGNLLLRAMMADVADRHRLATGVDRTALFFSVFSISAKGGMAAAVGIALPLVGWLGFDPAAPAHDPAGLRGLAIVFAIGPAAMHLAAALLIRRFPIDEARHAEIRGALAAREDARPGG